MLTLLNPFLSAFLAEKGIREKNIAVKDIGKAVKMEDPSAMQ